MIAPRSRARCPAATVLVMAVACLLPPALSAREQPEPPVHPQLWPQAASQGLLDRATEAKISALIARMSGSGATCFALFAAAAEARAAARRLKSEKSGWWVASGRLL